MYDRATSIEPSPLKRLIWSREAKKMHMYEMQALSGVDAVISLGSRDQALIRTRYGVRAEAWYPSLGDVPIVANRPEQRGVVGWLGPPPGSPTDGAWIG